MPIYEYVCQSCRAKFDHLARTMSGEAAVKCPQCDLEQTKRSLSVFAVAADSAKSSAADAPPSCGRCGGVPGSCGM